MAAIETIKINKAMKLLLWKNSFKLDIMAESAYFPSILIKTLQRESNLFTLLPNMLESAYKQGKIDATDEIADKYESFVNSLK